MTLKKQAISGVKWTSISTIFLAITQLLKISILARFLDKTDFGLIAIVVFVLGFINLFVDMGLTIAILHKQEISKNEYASIYWLNFLFSIVLFGLLVFITPFIATFYNEPELAIIIPLMSLTIIFSAFGRQFKVIEQKELNFRFISIVDIIASIVSLIFAVILAYKNYGVYSLVYSVILLQILSNTAFLVKGIKRVGLKLHFSFSETTTFLRIGIYNVGGQVINYFNRDLDVLIIGKLFGVEILGGYSLAKQLVFRPAQIINPIITNVASPLLAKFQHNIKLLRENYLKLINLISTMNIAVYLTIIIFAHPIVRILYGEVYENIVILVRILSVYMMIRAIGNPVGSLIIATGRTDLGFYWNLFTIVIFPLAIVIGAQYSIEWVAGSMLIAMVVLFVPFWYFLIWKMAKIPFAEYIISMLPNLLIINYIKSAIKK
jgi:PST family polysaccharide transporter/teichuronic acid exporter